MDHGASSAYVQEIIDKYTKTSYQSDNSYNSTEENETHVSESRKVNRNIGNTTFDCVFLWNIFITTKYLNI